MFVYLGKRFYFEKITGNIILEIGERIGSWVETTVEQDFQTYKELAERVDDTVDMIQLEYGQYAQDFTECNGYKVNPETLAIEFSYPEPSDPEPQEPVYQKPLSAQTAELEARVSVTEDAILALMDMSLM